MTAIGTSVLSLSTARTVISTKQSAWRDFLLAVLISVAAATSTTRCVTSECLIRRVLRLIRHRRKKPSSYTSTRRNMRSWSKRDSGWCFKSNAEPSCLNALLWLSLRMTYSGNCWMAILCSMVISEGKVLLKQEIERWDRLFFFGLSPKCCESGTFLRSPILGMMGNYMESTV